MNNEEFESFEYLKKQIKTEIDRYEYLVSRHGYERISPTLHIQIHRDEGEDILNFQPKNIKK